MTADVSRLRASDDGKVVGKEDQAAPGRQFSRKRIAPRVRRLAFLAFIDKRTCSDFSQREQSDALIEVGRVLIELTAISKSDSAIWHK